MAEPDYGTHAPKPPDATQLATIFKLADELLAAEVEVEKAGAALKERQLVLEELARNKLPEAMRPHGLEELPLPNGKKLVLKDKVKASIPRGSQDAAFRWLEDNQHGGMIKRTLSVSFNRDQQEIATKTRQKLLEQFPDTLEDRWVESQTLLKLVREQLADGSAFPKELFGVFRYDEAEVQEPKAKKARKGRDEVFDS